MTLTDTKIEEILSNHATWLHTPRSGERADFRHVDLRGKNFAGRQLDGACFDNADLRGADFAGAKLNGASFRGADLRGANMRGSEMCNTNLREATTGGTDFAGAVLDDADMDAPTMPFQLFIAIPIQWKCK